MLSVIGVGGNIFQTWHRWVFMRDVYEFICRCEGASGDRTTVHYETRGSQNVPPCIHNGSFRYLKPLDNILFEILQQFCTDEVIKKKEEGKDF